MKKLVLYTVLISSFFALFFSCENDKLPLRELLNDSEIVDTLDSVETCDCDTSRYRDCDCDSLDPERCDCDTTGYRDCACDREDPYAVPCDCDTSVYRDCACDRADPYRVDCPCDTTKYRDCDCDIYDPDTCACDVTPYRDENCACDTLDPVYCACDTSEYHDCDCDTLQPERCDCDSTMYKDINCTCDQDTKPYPCDCNKTEYKDPDCWCDTDTEEEEVMSYESDIQPIWNTYCTVCHDETHQINLKKGYSFESLQSYITSGYPEASKVYEYISSESPYMPQNPPYVSAEECEKVRLWIKQGANNNKKK